MARMWMRIAIGTGAVLGAIVLFVALILAFANTGFGRDQIVRLIGSLSGGQVRIAGLRGSFPADLRATRVDLADKDGVWLNAEDVAIQWSPLALLGNHVAVGRLSAAHVQVERLPVSESPGGVPAGTPTIIDVGALDIARLDTGGPLAGRPMRLSLKGSLHYVTLNDVSARLDAERQDSSASYRLDATFKDGVARGTAVVAEGPRGLVAGLLGLNDIGPIRLMAEAKGPPGANQIEASLDAGPLHVASQGTVDILRHRADVAFSAAAPAMALTPDLSWDSLAAAGHVRGDFAEPMVTADARLLGARVGGAEASEVTAQADGAGGILSFKGAARGLKLAGLDPALLAKAPLDVTGEVHLKATPVAVMLRIAHPLLTADAQVSFNDKTTAIATLNLPTLKPFAALGGVGLDGRGTFTTQFEAAGGRSRIALNGAIEDAAGDSAVAKLLGRAATLSLDATVNGNDIAISNAALKGAGIDGRLSGTVRDRALDLGMSLALIDLNRLSPALKGNAVVQARAQGPMATAKLEATTTASIATEGFSEQEIHASLRATGLPQPTNATFRMSGGFDGAPVSFAGAAVRAGSAYRVRVERGDWKSLRARADITIADAGALGGRATLSMNDLRDLAPLVGEPLEGAAAAEITFAAKKGRPSAQVNATVDGLHIAAARVGRMTVAGEAVAADKTAIALSLRATSIAVAGMSGNVSAELNGPADAVGVSWAADLKDEAGHPLKVTGRADVDSEAERATLSQLVANYQNQTLTLQSPAMVAFGDGLVVERFSARVGSARFTLNGTLSPNLAATASAQNVTAELLQPFVPLSTGAISATASLGGSMDAPTGTVRVQGRQLRFARVPASVVPAALDAQATLGGHSLSIDASMTAGSATDLKITGRAPIGSGESFHLIAKGRTDLDMFNPLLSAEGRNIRGKIALDAVVEGTMDEPKITGTADLSGGEIQDYPRALRLRDITVKARFAGETIMIDQFAAKAGDGAFTGSGMLDLAAAGMPVRFTIQAKNAQPVSSDRFRAAIDADVAISGEASGALAAAGTITIRRGEIVLPDSLPPRLVTLAVRRRGEVEAPPAKPEAGRIVKLDITIRSPNQFFVRGRGLDAELEGELHIGGTAANPIVAGALMMRRGTLDLAGQTLTFTSGRVSFDGAGLANRLDPTLDFSAETTSGAVTARLTIGGYASAPRIQLSSTPSVPQDEILARLMFEKSTKELSPFELAAIAEAAASLTGIGGGAASFNPLASVRRSLGLDRLAVGSTNAAPGSGSQTTVEAGKYIARNVYVGAKQGFGNTTEAEVQVDLTRNLKAKATVNSGTSAQSTQGAQTQQLGSSIGLSYQFDY